jgi:hypothetical protein
VIVHPPRNCFSPRSEGDPTDPCLTEWYFIDVGVIKPFEGEGEGDTVTKGLLAGRLQVKAD